MNTQQMLPWMEGNKAAYFYPTWEKNKINPDKIVEVYASLDEDIRICFDVILLQRGTLSFSIETMHKWHGLQVTGIMLKFACKPLLQLGFLASIRMTWGEQRLFIPNHIYTCFLTYKLQCLSIDDVDTVHKQTKSFLSSLPTQYEVEADCSIKESGCLWMDIFQLLVYAMKAGLPLTSQGLLHKRTLSCLQTILRLDEQALSFLTLNVSFPEHFPRSVTVVLDTALRLGVLTKEENCYHVQIEQVRRWFMQEEQVFRQAILDITIEHYVIADSMVRHLIYMVFICGQNKHWSTDETLIHRLIQLAWLDVNDEGRLNFIRGQIRAWLHVAHAFGLCNVISHEHTYLFRIPDEVCYKDQRILFIQSDYEIIVPKQTSFMIRWELEVFADRCHVDQTDIYRVTRESIMRSVKHGRTAQSILKFLDYCAVHEIPPNVRNTIKSWANQYGKLHVTEVTLLRCLDKEIATQVTAAFIGKEIRTRLVPVGEKDFIVEPKDLKAITNQLEKCELPIITHEKEMASTVCPQLWQAKSTHKNDIKTEIVYSSSSFQYDEIDTTWLEQQTDDWIQQGNITKQWTQKLYPYHLSTKQEIVKTAIQIQTKLEVEQAGRVFTVVPLSVHQSSSTRQWFIIGHIWPISSFSKPIQLNPIDWDKVRLIILESRHG